MNENEKQPNTQPEKSALDEKRKNALLRYIAIMFAVAFVFVLLSMFGQMRDSKTTISQLNQSSVSALQKAEALQEHNQELEKENAYLKGRIKELENKVKEAETALAEADAELEQAETDYDALKKEMEQKLEEAEEERFSIVTAYEQLLEAQNLKELEQDATSALNKLKENLEYLGDYALEIYENLIKKGE